MYFKLAPHTTVGLTSMALMALNTGSSRLDILGLNNHSLNFENHGEGDEMMDKLAADLLNGQSIELRQKMLYWPSLKTMNTVTADIIHDIGLDPMVVLVLGEILESRQKTLCIIQENIDDDHDETIIDFDYNWEIKLGKGVVYNSLTDFSAHIYIPPIPHSLAGSIAGKMLRDVVSHPVTDRFNLEIKSVHSKDDTLTCMLVETEYPMLNKNDLNKRYGNKIAKAA